jgi:hypothetical protein
MVEITYRFHHRILFPAGALKLPHRRQAPATASSVRHRAKAKLDPAGCAPTPQDREPPNGLKPSMKRGTGDVLATTAPILIQAIPAGPLTAYSNTAFRRLDQDLAATLRDATLAVVQHLLSEPQLLRRHLEELVVSQPR